MLRLSDIEVAALQNAVERDRMAIKLFRPQSQQEPFFLENQATFVLVCGGNRSTVAGTRLWKCNPGKRRPTDTHPILVEDIEVGDSIVGFKDCGKRKDLQTAVVESIDRYEESTYRLTTKRGYVVAGTHDHPVWACPPKFAYNNSADADWRNGQWVLLRDLQEGWFVKMAFGSYVGFPYKQDDDAYFHGLMDGDGSVVKKKSTTMNFSAHIDETLRHWIASYVESKEPGINIRVRQKSKCGIDTEWCSRAMKDEFLSYQLPGTPEAMASYVRGLLDADGCVTGDGKIVLIQRDTERVRLIQNLLLMFGIKCSTHLQAANLKLKRPNPIWRLQIGGCSVRRYAESIGFGEDAKAKKLAAIIGGRREPSEKKSWWDRVSVCGPTGEKKLIIALSTSLQTYVSNGIVSHNSGKSTSAAVKFAAAALDMPVTLSDGTEVHCRRPHQRGKTLTMWCIGFDEKHIGQTLHRLLFKPGLFKTAYDPDTKKLRAWNYDHDDPEKVKQRESPPLIPKRYIKKMNMKKAGDKVFSSVEVIDPATGNILAEIFAYGSKGDPKQGDPVDIIWVDEQLMVDGYIDELKPRLVDRKGFLFWSSWPNADSEQLDQMVEFCKREESSETPEAKMFTIAMSANKALDKASVKTWLSACSSPEEAMARDQGLFVGDQYRVYPQFDSKKQNFLAIVDDLNIEDKLSAKLRETNGEPPADWTRELILDPGTNHPAVLLCAVPPKEFGEYMVVYREVYPGRADPWELASRTKAVAGSFVFNRFIGDRRAGRQQTMGMMEGYKVFDGYAEAFAQFGLKCTRTGTSFLPACDNPGSRMVALNSWMQVNNFGFSTLRIVRESCPKLCEQITKAKKKVLKREVMEERRAAGQFDVLDCLEYWATSYPSYEPPPTNSSFAGTKNWQWFRKKFHGAEQNQSPVRFGAPY
jgi:hypothetical protein